MTEQQPVDFQFSIKALLAVTTVFAVLVYVLRTSFVFLMSLQALLPTAVGLAIRIAGKRLPRSARPWAAMCGLIFGSIGIATIQHVNYSEQTGNPPLLFALALPAWLPQCFLMHGLIKGDPKV